MSPYAPASHVSAAGTLAGSPPVYRTRAASAPWLVRESLVVDPPPPPEPPSPPVLPRLARLLAGTPSDPWSDPDTIEELADRIAVMAGHIHAAEQRFLLMLAEFDWRRGWELSGHRTSAEWLSERTGFDLGACRERVRTARKLVGLPLTAEAMGRGELSFSQVRALTRVATAENETALLELAKGVPTRKLETMVRGWKRKTRETEEERARDLYASRRLSVFPDEEGMYVISGRLPAEVGLVLQKAIQAAMEELFREGTGNGPDLREVEVRQREAARMRADALGLMAERVLGVGMGVGDDGVAAGAPPAPVSGSQAERFQVMLHVDGAGMGAGMGSGTGVDAEVTDSAVGSAAGSAAARDLRTVTAASSDLLSHLEDGTRVSPETSRRICCDAGVSEVRLDAKGHPLDVGRRRRTIPPALRRALELRDRGCRFPGCPVRHFTAGHHVRHWAEGGETKLDNLLLLCRHHHRLVHEGGWRVRWQNRGNPIFFDPRGGPHFDGRWKLPRLDGVDGGGAGSEPSDPVALLIAENQRLNGAAPDGWTASVRWKLEGDIPSEVYFPAVEAIGEARGEVE